jgi:hypothetical protein
MPTLTENAVCPRCGAPWRPGADKCWLCYLPLENVSAEAPPETKPSPTHAEDVSSASGFSLASLMMAITLASVVCGVSTFAPGVGIPLGVVLLAVWVKTAERARHRRQIGQSLTWAETIQLFFASFGVVIAMMAVVAVAGAAAFAVACFVCATAFGEHQTGAIALVGAIGAGLAIPLLWAIIRAIRSRWLGETL